MVAEDVGKIFFSASLKKFCQELNKLTRMKAIVFNS